MKVEAFPDSRFRGVLRQVIPTADRTKATVQVKVTILDKDARLRPEMSAKVEFREPAKEAPAGGAPVVSVPREALARRDGKPVVFEVVEGRARERAVVAGAESQGRVTVTSGLVGTERLVANPPEALKDGDAVTIKN